MNKNLLTLPKLFSLLISGLIFSASTHAEDIDPSPETTRLLASQCAQCHGTTGNSRGDFDSIAGEDFQELLSELLDMRESDDNKVMHKQVKGYTEQHLWYIADYYSKLPRISTDERILPDSEGKDGEEDKDIELSEAEKKILEAEKKAFEKAREDEKEGEEDEEQDEEDEDENNE